MAASTPKITRVISPNVAEPQAGTWSNCLVVNGIAYVAGMVAREADGTLVAGGEYEQSKVIFSKIKHLLEAAGGAMADVIKVTIFVTDIRNREQVWRARREFFTGNFPASTLVEVRALADPGLKVEIEAVAYLGAGARRRSCCWRRRSWPSRCRASPSIPSARPSSARPASAPPRRR